MTSPPPKKKSFLDPHPLCTPHIPNNYPPPPQDVPFYLHSLSPPTQLRRTKLQLNKMCNKQYFITNYKTRQNLFTVTVTALSFYIGKHYFGIFSTGLTQVHVLLHHPSFQ